MTSKGNIKKRIVRSLEWLILLFVVVITVMPILYTLMNSFMENDELVNRYHGVFGVNEKGVHEYIGEQVGLTLVPSKFSTQQYKEILLAFSGYLKQFWNSVIYTFPIVLIQVFLAAMTAYGICRIKSKLRYLIILGYIMVILLPYQVTLFPNYLVIQYFELLDTRWSIWLLGFFSPFSVYFMERYMSRIPQELVEAAKLDGAGTIRIFFKLYLPCCKSVIYSCCLLVFVDCWNMVEQPGWMLESEELQPLSVFLSQVSEGDIGIVFAASIIYLIPPLLLFLYGENDLEEGLG